MLFQCRKNSFLIFFLYLHNQKGCLYFQQKYLGTIFEFGGDLKIFSSFKSNFFVETEKVAKNAKNNTLLGKKIFRPSEFSPKTFFDPKILLSCQKYPKDLLKKFL